MVAVGSSETLVYFYQTTRRHIPEDYASIGFIYKCVTHTYFRT
jgi:hypothetical protein